MFSCNFYVLFLICFSRALGCSPGWLAHGSSCYHFSHDKEDWAEAVTICRILGGYLVEVNDDAETQYLRDQAKLLNKQFWIGLNDLQEEGTWVWAESRTRATYTHWVQGEPNNSGSNENCVLLEPGHDYQWNDGMCQYSINYICEASAEQTEVIG